MIVIAKKRDMHKNGKSIRRVPRRYMIDEEHFQKRTSISDCLLQSSVHICAVLSLCLYIHYSVVCIDNKYRLK